LGEGKSDGPDHRLYVDRLEAMGVVCDIEGWKRTVASEKVDPALGRPGILVSPAPPELTSDTVSIEGKG